MTRTVAEGMDVVNTAKETGAVFQVGSQQGSSILNQKARELIAAGAIGEINTVESKSARNSSLGAWQYSVARDATPETLDWDRFLGSAPKRPFEPIRAFRWRCYWDYGTAVAGDIFVHHFTAIHKAVNSLGPETVMASGGLRYWKDGRDVYDVIAGICNYPETENHPGFTLTLLTNWVAGGGPGGYFKYVGSEGELAVEGGGLTLRQVGLIEKNEHPPEQVLSGYNSVYTWSEASRKQFAEWFMSQRPGPKVAPPMAGETRYQPPEGYDSRFDHFANFFDSVRNGTPVFEDAAYGHRAAAPANLCNDSYREGKVMKWDPKGMELLS
jgi:predicted dehydrogenase